jgi:S1-C subfamily serine protease
VIRSFLMLSACAVVGCSAARAAPPTPPAPTLPAPSLATAPQPTRREIIRAVISHSVRVKVLDGKKAQKLGSGVVIASSGKDAAAESWVVTNAHVVKDEGYAHENVQVLIDQGAEVKVLPAQVVAHGKVPELDLALLRVKGIALPPAPLAAEEDLELGDSIVVAAAPYGKDLSLSAGIVSQLEMDRASQKATMLKTDASIGYGASGGGIFSLHTGKLLAIVEGYRTAKVDFAVQKQAYSFDVPMPGETFAAPAPKVRRFLEDKGYLHLVDPARPVETVQAADVAEEARARR